MAKHPIWSNAARADVRALDRATAIGLLESFNRYLATGEGNVKQLRGKESEFRLRLGDYRLCFTPENDLLRVHWVRHRREAYRD
jgi:mRNA-degrading endonuclease RelE of RelBE toxin-antitoxin system